MKVRVPSLAAAVFLLAGCSSPSKPILVDVAWGLTCSGTQPANCNPLNVAGKSWDYIAEDGDIATDTRTGVALGRVSASCRAIDIGGGNERFSMKALVGGSYIEVENLDVARDTSTLVGTSCRTSVYDGISLFGGSVEGRCGSTAPATGSPCQITMININPDDTDGPSIEFRMLCSALPNAALPSSKLSVRDSSDVVSPAIIRFANCSGI